MGWSSSSPNVFVVTEIDERTGERFIVRGADVCSAAVELAVQVRIELED